MKPQLYSLLIAVATPVIITNHCFSQANTTLSNLTSPTAVNKSLLPVANNIISLGTTVLSWKDIYIDGALYLDDHKFISDKGPFSTLIGIQAGNSNDGSSNSALGYRALYSNTSGDNNTANGYEALYFNEIGNENTATGYQALYSNGSGDFNTAFGFQALYSATYNYNSAFGYKTLYFNTDGFSNSAVGHEALYSNTSGYHNTAVGVEALYSNSTGAVNTALGFYSLNANTTGFNNSAVGHSSLKYNTTGYTNTSIGVSGLANNTTGYSNTAAGYGSGEYNDANTFCSFFGYDADQEINTDLTNSMALGNASRITFSNQVRIGNASVLSIGGYQNWSNISDGRYKQNVKENVKGLGFINLLKPVTYTLDINGISRFLGEDITAQNGETGAGDNTVAHAAGEDGKQLIQQGRDEKSKIIYSGFIAQDVEAAANKAGYDFSGVDKPQNEHSLYGLRYAEFVVPLVKAVQEIDAEAKIQESRLMDLEEENDALKKENINQQKQIDELRSLITNNNSSLNDGVLKMGIAENTAPMLGQNIPNPFDNSTIIPFRIPKDCNNASIVITESGTGRMVTAIPITCNETYVAIESGNLASGSYTYSLYVDGRMVDTRRMGIVK